MKITLIRQDNGSGKETLSICEAGTLFDKMKTETKAGHITALREIIPLLEGSRIAVMPVPQKKNRQRQQSHPERQSQRTESGAKI